MLVSFSVCQRDEANALTTLAWAHSLDGKLPYDAILSVGDGVEAEPIHAAMEKLFRSVTEINSYAPNTWPMGKNSAFQNLVRYLDDKRITESFLWWEPDAIPLKRGWLQAIEAEHLAGGKAFSGFVYDHLRAPSDWYMDCVGVYPHNFMEYSPTRGMLCRAASWDVCCGLEIIQHVHRMNTLIQCVHDKDGFPPTFENGDLSLIRKDAVLFHKSKEGSLVEQLSKGTIKRFIGNLFRKSEVRIQKSEPITVVFAPCAKDIDQAIHHAKWLQKLGQKWANKAVVASDFECPVLKLRELSDLLSHSFVSVASLIYQNPPDKSYPAVANWAFKQVAETMAHQTAPWFWMESDCVALKADWLEVLQKEYEAGGKPFMGPVVKESGFGHANGSCVYPHDTVQRIPKALRQTNVAWDYAAREELNGDVHDVSGIVFHIWGMVNGQPSATNGSEAPRNFTAEMARRIIPKTAVVIHRIKDTSLIDLLMKGEVK